jgi:hypothetical protein
MEEMGLSHSQIAVRRQKERTYEKIKQNPHPMSIPHYLNEKRKASAYNKYYWIYIIAL